MPLYLVFQCCKCKQSLSKDLWSIAKDHYYYETRYVCEHFDVIIDHKSSIGFFGIGWSNEITITAECKEYYCRKDVIHKTFNSSCTEYQNYSRFGKFSMSCKNIRL